jgi:hypothetical protein
VPSLPGDDCVELAPCGVPGFELCHLHVEPGLPGQVGHPRVGIDPEHPAPRRLELPGRYAGAATDIEDVLAGARGDDAVHQGAGITGPRPVVTFGVRTERLRHLPVPMRFICCYRWCSLVFGLR